MPRRVLPGWGPGGYTGRVIRDPAPRSQTARGGSQNQRSGPRRPCKGRSGWVLGAGRTGTDPRAPAHPPTHPCGARSVLASQALPGRGWAPRAETATFDLIFHKVSQNDRVSPKYVEKACHSPCLQNGPQNSPLDFLRFPILPAFSHKELMGLF